MIFGFDSLQFLCLSLDDEMKTEDPQHINPLSAFKMDIIAVNLGWQSNGLSTQIKLSMHNVSEQFTKNKICQ